MHIVDRVYGEHFVDEPVIDELVRTSHMQRLRGIQQYGLPFEYYPVEGYTRFEHSVGVMLLLRNLKASLTQQVAGLLHDVSHLAFSHVTDSIFGEINGRNAQDERHSGFILSSGIPPILERWKLDTAIVSDLEAHPLLDRAAPDLCADRVDYSLREFATYMEPERLRAIVSDLIVFDGRIMFSTAESAALFGVNFLLCHAGKWASPEKTLRQHIFATLIKSALEQGILTYRDLIEGDDEHALRILRSSDAPCVRAGLRMLSGDLLMAEDEASPQLVLSRMSRQVDPEFLLRGRPVRLSGTDSTYRELLSAHRALCERPLKVSILHSIERR